MSCMRVLVLSLMVVAVGCGGRTELLDGVAGNQHGGTGGNRGQPSGTGGHGGPVDGRRLDALVAPDTVPGPGPDAAAEGPSDLRADSGADARPDLAIEVASDGRGGADGGSIERFDVATERRADGQADSNPDALLDGNPDVPRDLPGDRVDAGPDVERDLNPGDRIDTASATDALGPGLWVLAGLLSGPGALDGVGNAAQFYFPSGLAYDGTGNLYVADAANNTIRKIVLATGEVTTVAGSLGLTGGDDGIGVQARFYSPQGLATDGAGNLYVADSVNSTIRKMVMATGEVTTLAGLAAVSAYRDGRGAAARFELPQSLAYDGAGSLFVADADGTIRKIVLATAEVTTLAGSATEVGSQDGTGQGARFSNPLGIVWDGAGNLFVADTRNHTLRKIVVATGVVTTFAGAPGLEGSDDGMGLAARFSYPNGLAVDGNGNLLVADTGGNRIRKIVVATGSVTTLAGFSGACGSRDGSGDLAEFCSPTSLVCDGAGNLFVTESGNHTVRKVVVATGAVATFAGRGSSTGSDDGIGGHARFSYPTGLVSDNGGNLLVADSVNHTIRKVVVATGAVSTVAGLAGYGGSVDGTGNGARFNFPVDLAYDGAGSVFVADQDNMLIRKVVVATAAVTTMAGSAGQAGSDDGIGMAARFAQPSALAFDGAGSLFVADGAMHTIRQIALATAAVTTLAGSAGVAGSDDGVGTNARFHTPSGLACDGAGQLFVADRGNYTIRKIVIATGTVTTLAGAAGEAGTDDGPGTAARFLAPEALTKDRAGNLFVADVEGNTVRHVDVITGVVTTVVGHARRWQIVPGPLPAYIASPGGLAVLPSGDLAITDRLENVVLLARF